MKANEIKVPRGYTIKINARDPDYVKISLYRSVKNSVRIGFVHLSRLRDQVYETHSELDEEYHNQGLGALMYARAIQWGLKRGYKIRSSGASSFEARRVWNGKTLRKFFSLKKRAGRTEDTDTWYAYPKKR